VIPSRVARCERRARKIVASRASRGNVMSTLSVWRFDAPEGAARAEDAVLRLQEQELVTVHDAAVGAAVGTRFGALGGALTDVGIDDDFIASVRANVPTGTSALFLLTSHAVVDKVKANLEGQDIHGTVIQTHLTDEQEGALRRVFAEN
jgi:uncharacterized membrane protein